MQYAARVTRTALMPRYYYDTMRLWGVSVFVAGAPLRRNDFFSFYSAKETFMGDQYRERYPIGATTITDAQLRERII